MHLQLLSSIHSRCLSYPSSLSSCWCIHGVQIVVTIRCKYIWITLASSYCRITLEKPQKLAAMDCIVYEWSNKQTSKQTQSVLAGEATSRKASKHSRCKHNLDDAASADTHSSPGPQEWETNESASRYNWVLLLLFFYLQFTFANLCFHCCEISMQGLVCRLATSACNR